MRANDAKVKLSQHLSQETTSLFVRGTVERLEAPTLTVDAEEDSACPSCNQEAGQRAFGYLL